jgi:hypothetical protein
MSKKLEKARFIVYETYMYNHLKKCVTKMIDAVKEDHQINKDIIKLINLHGNEMMEEIAVLYSKLFTYEELDKIHKDLLTEKGKKMFKKTNKLAVESFNIGSMFAEKIFKSIEEMDKLSY